MTGVEIFGIAAGGVINMIAHNRAAMFVAVGVFVFLFLLAMAFSRRRPPYRLGRFLSDNEKQFLRALDETIGDNYRVFAQVRLADLVDVGPSVSDSRRRAAMARVFGKSIDFVICDAVTLDPVAAIEVDDRTHLLARRKQRDTFVNSVFKEIGLPLLHAPARRHYTHAALSKMLTSAGLDTARRGVALRAREPS